MRVRWLEEQRLFAACSWALWVACAAVPASSQEPAAADAAARKQALRRAAGEASSVGEVQRVVRELAERLAAEDIPTELRFADSHDWVQTRSGEWIRGGVDWMRDDIMEFDSEEFGALEVHMRDVALVHAAHVDTYVFQDRTALQGPAIFTEHDVIVQTAAGVQVRPRDELWAIVEGGGRELDHWSTGLELGMSGNRGNSDQIDFNLGWKLVREDRRTRTELTYRLNLGRADGEQNVSRHIGELFNRVWLTERVFLNPMIAQLLSDKFQDIRFRAQPSAGPGVRLVHTKSVWWNVSGGLGYQYLRLSDPAPTVSNPQHDGLVRLSTRARFDVTGDFYLLISWMTNLTYTNFGNSNHTGVARLLFEVTNRLNLETSFLYLRTEEPQLRSDDSRPEKNDFWVTLGLSLQLG